MRRSAGNINLPASARARYILQALLTAAAAFLMLDAAFLLYALIVRFFELFVSGGPGSGPSWVTAAATLMFLAVVTWTAKWTFTSRFNIVVKAAFVSVPTAIIIVSLGIIFFNYPVWSCVTGALAAGGILAYFWRKRKPWLYFYSVILVSLALAAFTLAGGEI